MITFIIDYPQDNTAISTEKRTLFSGECIIPRIGDGIQVKNIPYRVWDVVWIFNNDKQLACFVYVEDVYNIGFREEKERRKKEIKLDNYNTKKSFWAKLFGL